MSSEKWVANENPSNKNQPYYEAPDIHCGERVVLKARLSYIVAPRRGDMDLILSAPQIYEDLKWAIDLIESIGYIDALEDNVWDRINEIKERLSSINLSRHNADIHENGVLEYHSSVPGKTLASNLKVGPPKHFQSSYVETK